MDKDNQIVNPGISGQAAVFDSSKVSHEDLTCELALLNLGDFEPLDIKIDTTALMRELDLFKNDWVDYLPRTDRPNNRKGLTLTNLIGKSHKDNPSLAQAQQESKDKKIKETDFGHPTELYWKCTSLHPFLKEWEPLGRTFFVKSDIGGYFVPHRDHPSMPREVFRLICFVNNCGPLDYDWLMDDRKINIELGRVYYVNTRKTHRTISWSNDSTHLILNVPMNSINVAKVIAHLQHRH